MEGLAGLPALLCCCYVWKAVFRVWPVFRLFSVTHISFSPHLLMGKFCVALRIPDAVVVVAVVGLVQEKGNVFFFSDNGVRRLGAALAMNSSSLRNVSHVTFICW